ncbi:MAG: DegT/DnrJ/EryC1/StrS family aminotransferase [Bernardetiaceae bacterium]|jgi:dTDP-4-amino-4,6-dideoxygalactose transaminase|nr:DegT/DnrJ/EryC1/StrS family aminotransferase [Bernardetiaceae bacterium]
MAVPLIEYENLAKANAPFQAELEAAFRSVSQRGWFVLGQAVETFEEQFAHYCQAAHCVGVGSGLDALRIALEASQLRSGGEVIVAGNVFVACLLAIGQAGLRPRLVEPDPLTYNLDPDRVAEAIGPNTVALMPVHLYGKMCDMPRLLALAEKHGLWVVEDAAQAHGASLHGRRAGSWGHCAAFSFYPTKNLGALGDGGAVVTNSPTLAQRAKLLRNYGSGQKYHNQVLGYNSRLDELQAAFLTVKLAHLEPINQHKRQLAAIYQTDLGPQFVKPAAGEGYRDAFHIYPVRHPARDRLREHLRAHGVRTEIHYPVPPHRQPALQNLLGDLHLPLTDQLAATELSLPISYGHTPAEVARVVEAMNGFS